jgi:hypothetical protein
MKTKLWLFLAFCLIFPLVFQPNAALAAPSAELASPADVKLSYGLVRDSVDPQLFTAVVYPNFSSNDVTISTASFTFLLPSGTTTSPSIADAPAMGALNNVNGTWTVQKLTPSVYASVGFNAADLSGSDVYQAVLSPGSATPELVNGEALPLFSFRITDGCSDGAVQILTNDSSVQQALFNSLGANFNNQMSMSVNGMPAMDQYTENNPGGTSVLCTVGQDANIRFFLPFVNR